MDNLDADRLPEANSLPDGFVESSVEPLAPATPLNDTEKPSQYCKESRLMKQECTHFEDETKGEANRKEPFKDSLGSFVESAEVSERDASVKHKPNESSYKDLMDPHITPIPAEANDKNQSETEAVENSSTGAQEDHLKAASSSSDHSKNIKEVTESKRKSSKRTFRTEKEFLEFTLSYQQVIAERDSAISVRDKLESLCRELQRQNKDECKRVSEEGQNLRLDISRRFHDAIKDVSSKLEQQKGESLTQLKENETLRDKLKQLVDQYALSEQQHAQQLKQKTLELKIADLKIQQAEEKLYQEQEQMKHYAEQVSQLLTTEKSLRLQLTADGEKFQQFQDALQKSNEVFETFKQEIEKMSKSIKGLKKENAFLKSKCDKSDFTLIELVEERERMKKQLEKMKNQKEKLESLCRSLQAERKQNSDDKKTSEAVIAEP
ncbi:hypothetical protein V2J09_001371 [Rumex salicifolius]